MTEFVQYLILVNTAKTTLNEYHNSIRQYGLPLNVKLQYWIQDKCPHYRKFKNITSGFHSTNLTRKILCMISNQNYAVMMGYDSGIVIGML